MDVTIKSNECVIKGVKIMANKKYSKSEEVYEALATGKVKRNSILVMKRLYNSSDTNYSKVLEDGIVKYDNSLKSLCSFYNKSIDLLTVHELVQLEANNKNYFTQDHIKKYSMLMLGIKGVKVNEYKGMLITPDEIKNL